MKAISSLKRLGAYIKPYKVQFILVLLFTVATVGFNAAMPYVSGLPTTEISRNIAAGEGVNFDYVILCLIWIAVVGVGYCFSQLMDQGRRALFDPSAGWRRLRHEGATQNRYDPFRSRPKRAAISCFARNRLFLFRYAKCSGAE